MNLIFTLALICPNVTIINNTTVWNNTDAEILTMTIKRCKELYINSPCLKVFTKVEENTYRVICGRKVET